MGYTNDEATDGRRRSDFRTSEDAGRCGGDIIVIARPCFQITIDTEGDNLWSRPAAAGTRNAEYLPRFQTICEKYGLKPTYLTNWEMAHSPAMQALGRDILKRGTGEIGMHLHAWDSPPLVPLTADDAAQHPYLIEYPEAVMRQKVGRLTAALEDLFQARMVSHRAGRWAFNATYARILADHGYKVDCSVTPHVSWRRVMGAATGNGGSDYTGFPDRAYWWELGGAAELLEVPVSIVRQVPALPMRAVRRLLGRPACRTLWLRPNGRNLKDLFHVLDEALRHGRDYVQFMLHSSELMPGGSPSFDTADKIETLYAHLDQLFSRARRNFDGATLGEYAAGFNRSRAECPSAPSDLRVPACGS